MASRTTSDQVGKNSRSQGDQPYQRDAISRETEICARSARRCGVSHMLAGQCAQKRNAASLERAINRYAHRRTCLGGAIRLRFEQCLRNRRVKLRKKLQSSFMPKCPPLRDWTWRVHQQPISPPLNLYTRAKNLLLMTSFTTSAKANLLQAIDLLNQAVAHDSSFFQAYCQLAHTTTILYFFGFDHTPARLALARVSHPSGIPPSSRCG